MGLFGKKGICTICNVNEGSKDIADGCVCKSCISKTYPFIITLSWKKITSSQIHKAIEAAEQNARLKELFQPTKKIEKYFSIDENNRLWQANGLNVIFSYDDIISYDLLEDGESITKGGIGSAAVGGILFGGVGAVVGGVTGKKKTKQEINEFRVKIVTRNEMCKEVYINFLTTGAVKSDSFLYKSYKNSAQSIITELAVILDSCSSQEKPISNAEEISKYKKLFDDGVITQEEFEAKKKQLLGL